MKRISFVLFLIVLNCCSSSPKVNFTVTNFSGHVIDSLIIDNGFDFLVLRDIGENEEIECVLSFSDKVFKGDGLHQVQAYGDDIELQKRFGYFSNGAPTVNKYLIRIYQDSISTVSGFN